ncbi:sugar ABC transporter ATP-binding protein [Microbacterium sp. Marseille-Q6648]|uniref:sugar ABC transporter ATP-binding protein n=1 Tax=Microbacterium sp. Marseille-Q6648 TaxID=2937991 RepID=UPI00203C407B|nr:sugar ABC transporter ATP-binding protein [Microbacterium sp. Marseille-Q6648]
MSDARSAGGPVTVVRMSAIKKKYAGVQALKGVDFDVAAGEVHCLIGENGAGKSTLMRILTGAEVPTSGTIEIGGETHTGLTPPLALRSGVCAIYQETDLVPELTVWQNMYLGHERRTRLGILDVRSMRREATRILHEIDVDLPVDVPVSALSAANAQLVQIAKALTRDSRVIIMDEPSAVLSDHELAGLFRIIRSLCERGIAIVYISHRLDEVVQLGDRVTVMRDGLWVKTVAVADTPIPEMIRAMVGRDLDDQFAKTVSVQDTVALSVESLTARGRFEDVSFDVRHGEVLGIAGLVGAGRSSVLAAIFGDVAPDAGQVVLNGRKLAGGSVRDAIRNGIGLVPEDRRGAGLVLGRSVEENIALPSVDRFATGPFVNAKERRAAAQRFIEEFRIRTPSRDQLVRFLSGGNQQKVVLAKWLARNVSVLLLDEPTVGVDVGAKSEIYALINRLAAEGLAIVMVSSDLPEVLGMSDRILVMSEGRVTAELSRADATQEVIMAAAVPVSAAVA